MNTPIDHPYHTEGALVTAITVLVGVLLAASVATLGVHPPPEEFYEVRSYCSEGP